MTEKINADKVIAVLDEIVAEKGDYVYLDQNTQCKYVDAEGSPSCIVGQVLYRLDLPLPAPVDPDQEDTWGSANVSSWVQDATEPFREPFTDLANQVLRYAQMVQDGDAPDLNYQRRSWAEAVAYAKEKINV
jgi:hypothetical protein